MANFRVEVRMADLVTHVYDEDTGYELKDEDPPNAETVAAVDFARDSAFGGCWFVRDINAGEWWGWRASGCDQLPNFQVRIDGDGNIKDVKFEERPGMFKKLDVVQGPATSSLRTTMWIKTDPEELATAACYYVVIGGRAYKIC